MGFCCCRVGKGIKNCERANSTWFVVAIIHFEVFSIRRDFAVSSRLFERCIVDNPSVIVLNIVLYEFRSDLCTQNTLTLT